MTFTVNLFDSLLLANRKTRDDIDSYLRKDRMSLVGKIGYLRFAKATQNPRATSKPKPITIVQMTFALFQG
jgi:hypothetical protein